MTHQDLEDTVPFYAIGALEKTERQALEAHLLSGCVPCRTILKEYQSVAVALPFELTLVPPPRHLRGKIMGARTMPQSAAVALVSPPKPSLEPGEWMNHLFPPFTASRPSFGWVRSMVFLAILGIVAASIAPFVTEYGLTFPILLDETNGVGNTYQLRSLPSSFFIDREGIIQEVVVGGPMAEALLRTRVEQILK